MTSFILQLIFSIVLVLGGLIMFFGAAQLFQGYFAFAIKLLFTGGVFFATSFYLIGSGKLDA